eukprot:CAMPEP_0204171174 /NCGR_PEP_ID=MMETSP0361-20130328/43005_1 /ASSEMBLY_ACC=CAM_ASM_000343 /TAXON_ID=268821 /ORGANISM="Scrippsiella Hangoei, Strain SHTV-5" /LENGTH=31 /DNA_ID= /DNA_START= /DNA_END= /DNA_ORIENTATION=
MAAQRRGNRLKKKTSPSPLHSARADDGMCFK